MSKTKIIVTNKSVMLQKYPDDWELLEHKINHDLVQFDLERGIETVLIYLDDPFEMEDYIVHHHESDAENKRAIDYIYNKYSPTFLIILGANDVVPFQWLLNPKYTKASTRVQKYMPSDLPYACDHPYSQRVDDFFAPSRIVSRLPDVEENGELGATVLYHMIYNITHTKPNPETHYRHPWAVCTTQRITPMELSLADMYDPNTVIPKTAPPNGPDWDTKYYEKRIHFHILHGSRKRNRLSGEDAARNTSPAIYGNYIDGNINLGTVVLERACFGTQLYNPDPKHPLPLANMYLKSGAAAMIGSGVQNYSDKNGRLLGDYMVSKFFKNLNNHTTGEAFLLARQQLVEEGLIRTRACQTMFGAFVLYGDASLAPMADKYYKEPQVEILKENSEKMMEHANYIGASFPVSEKTKEIVLKQLATISDAKVLDVACNIIIEDGTINLDQLLYTVFTEENGIDTWYTFITTETDAKFLYKYTN